MSKIYMIWRNTEVKAGILTVNSASMEIALPPPPPQLEQGTTWHKAFHPDSPGAIQDPTISILQEKKNNSQVAIAEPFLPTTIVPGWCYIIELVLQFPNFPNCGLLWRQDFS
jgi:hypothetical protein